MNKAESERIGSYLERQGYQETDSAVHADIIVLNSCVVRQSAENRFIGKLNSIKPLKTSYKPPILSVTGCFVSSDIYKLKQRFPFVDYFFKPGEPIPWLEKPELEKTIPIHPKPVTYISIIQGCNNFCTYCIVPYRRGRERSRPFSEILSEVKTLVGRGAREIVLLGQNVNSYGQDKPGHADLPELLDGLNDIDGLSRIRFLTNHPKDMSLRLINRIANLDKVCPEVSLPVQSGSNTILNSMGRGYTIEQYRELISCLRSKIPDIAISTDIIVGFPDETELNFQETYNLLSDLKFDTVHVAAYSVRAGTFAAREFSDNITLTEKKERLHRVEGLQKKISASINKRFLESTVEVMVEGEKDGRWWGRTKSGKLVFFKHDNPVYPGQLVNIIIVKASPWALQGSISTTES